MKRRLFTVLWWAATLGLAYVVIRIGLHLTIYSEPFSDTAMVILSHKLRPLWLVAMLYLACYVGYGTPFWPPRGGNSKAQ